MSARLARPRQDKCYVKKKKKQSRVTCQASKPITRRDSFLPEVFVSESRETNPTAKRARRRARARSVADCGRVRHQARLQVRPSPSTLCRRRQPGSLARKHEGSPSTSCFACVPRPPFAGANKLGASTRRSWSSGEPRPTACPSQLRPGWRWRSNERKSVLLGIRRSGVLLHRSLQSVSFPPCLPGTY
jgi:hypothetical protein